MKKISYLKVVLTYTISLILFLLSITFVYFITIDKNIFTNIGLLNFNLGFLAILFWSILFALWSTPQYKKINKSFYTENADIAITNITNILNKYGYKDINTFNNITTIKSKNPISNWFYGDITLESKSNKINLTAANIIVKNILKHI